MAIPISDYKSEMQLPQVQTGAQSGGGKSESSALSLLGPGLKTIGNVYSLYQSSKINKAREKKIKQRERELSDWFNKEYNKNILDTDYAKAIESQTKDRLKEINKRAASDAAILGATDESKIAQKSNIQEGIEQTQQAIAATGEARKEGVRREYIGRQAGIDSQLEDVAQQKLQNWENFQKNIESSFSVDPEVVGKVAGSAVGI